jgi:hypothetical protein
MQQPDYAIEMVTSKTPNEAYTAINNVHLWWTENFEGSSKRVNDEFKLSFGETFIKLRVAALVNNYKVVWKVIDCFKHFLTNKDEWIGTEICFDITNLDNKQTKISFTHFGLLSSLECYNICTDAWQGYIQGSLKRLIETGKGSPDKKVHESSNIAM